MRIVAVVIFALFLAQLPAVILSPDRRLLLALPDSEGTQEIFCIRHSNAKKAYVTARNRAAFPVICDIYCRASKDHRGALSVLSSRGVTLMAGQETAMIAGFRSEDAEYTAIVGGEYRCAQSAQ